MSTFTEEQKEQISGFIHAFHQLFDSVIDEENARRDLDFLRREHAAWLDAPGRYEKQEEYNLTEQLNRLKAGLKLSEPSPSEAKELDSSSNREYYEDRKKKFEEMRSEIKRMEREEAAGTWKSSVKSLQKQIIEILKERGEELDLARSMESWLKKEEGEDKKE